MTYNMWGGGGVGVGVKILSEELRKKFYNVEYTKSQKILKIQYDYSSVTVGKNEWRYV